ncbi:MAG: hypothetical protein ACW98U_07255 [Candidatus Thorarchaeota archaeon]
MKISKRAVGSVIGILLIAAVSSPFIFFSHYPDYEEVIELTLRYRHHEGTYTSTSGWDTGVDETIVLTFSTSLNNMSNILGTETIGGVPLLTDVSTWNIGVSVSLRGYSGTVDDDEQYYGHDCWVVAIDDETSVFYDKQWGLLVEKKYSDHRFIGYMDSEWDIIEYTLTSSNLNDFDSYYVSVEGWFFSGILVQLAVVIAFVYDRRSNET